jgi:hypothetical protein
LYLELTEEQITTGIQNRNDTIFEQLLTNQAIHEQTHKSSKRKRDDLSTQKSLDNSMKSLSQLSMSQKVSKKMKQSAKEEKSSNDDDNSTQSTKDHSTLYKPSKYLKMPRKLLLHSLHLQLNCPLKKKKEQRSILGRLVYRITEIEYFAL